MSLGGHFWTIGPRVKSWIIPTSAPQSMPFETTLTDPDRGPVRLTGKFSDVKDARCVVLLVHGLGGSAESHYCRLAARYAHARGWASLRLYLRGADRCGTDYYHGGLTADLFAAVASRELARFERIYVFGFSLGGHVTLRYATEVDDPRVKAVAALCAPLDLSLGRSLLDRTSGWLYRRHLLAGLKEIYAGVAKRASVPTPIERIMKVETLWDWDSLTVCPRFGFKDPEDYYRHVSVSYVLDRMRVDALVVASPDDPVVPAESIRHLLDPRPPRIDMLWTPIGGHVGFPSKIRWRDGRKKSVEEVILDWFEKR